MRTGKKPSQPENVCNFLIKFVVLLLTHTLTCIIFLSQWAFSEQYWEWGCYSQLADDMQLSYDSPHVRAHTCTHTHTHRAHVYYHICSLAVGFSHTTASCVCFGDCWDGSHGDCSLTRFRLGFAHDQLHPRFLVWLFGLPLPVGERQNRHRSWRH